MTNAILAPKELWQFMTPSAFSPSLPPAPVSGRDNNVVFLEPIEIQVSSTKRMRPGFVDVSAHVKELERDEKTRALFEAGRKQIAEHLEDTGEITLATLRLQKGWSQQRLADEMGTTQSYIARIEAGRDDIRVSTAARISEALGIELIAVVRAITARPK